MDFIGRQPGRKTVTSNGINTLRGHVRKNPNGMAVRTETSSLTYRELWRRATKLANAMLAQGIQKGDLVITYMPNCPQYVEIMVAAQMIGAPVTLGNYRLKGDEIAYQINDCRAAVVYVHADLLSAITDRKEGLTTVRHIVGIGPTPESVLNYEAFLDSGSETEPDIEVLPDDLHLLFYTSGTTGRPKGAARTMYSDYNVGVSICMALG